MCACSSLDCLADILSLSRFHVGIPTACLSSQALISLNTFASSTKGPDGDKDGSVLAETEDLARRAYTRLGTRGENQAVVFLWVFCFIVD